MPCKGEEQLAALTAGDRKPWAKARKQFFSTGVNKASLALIEGSSFVLVLDEEENNYDPVSCVVGCYIAGSSIVYTSSIVL